MKKLIILIAFLSAFASVEAQKPTPFRNGIIVGKFNEPPPGIDEGQLAWSVKEKTLYQYNGTEWEKVGDNFSIEDLDSTQSIDIGDIGSLAIDDGFNAFTFTGDDDPVQNQADGYVIINCVRNGLAEQYLFLGEGGSYGTTGSELASEEDFTLVDQNVPFQDVWRNDAGNVLAINYDQNIRHQGNVILDKRLTVGGGDNYGIINSGTGNLSLLGNQGVRIRVVNPNQGMIQLLSEAAFTVRPADNQNKYGVKVSKNFSDSFDTNNFRGVGFWLNDIVDFTEKTGNSYHTSLLIDPTILDTNTAHKAIDVISGWVDIQSGKLKIGDYTLPSSDGTANQVLSTDGSGNITWQNGGGDNTLGEVVINTATSTLQEADIQAMKPIFLTYEGDQTITIPEITFSDTKMISFIKETSGTVTIIPSENVNQQQYVFDATDLAQTLYTRQDDVWNLWRGTATVSAYIPPSANIILNSTFDDTSNITYDDPPFTVAGGVVSLSSGIGNVTFELSQDIVASQNYTLNLDILNGTGTSRFRLFVNQADTFVEVVGNTTYADGNVSIPFTAPSGVDSYQIRIATSSAATAFDFDNVTLTQD